MKKLLQFFILIMMVNIAPTITASAAYEERRAANKQRIATLKQKSALDVKNQRTEKDIADQKLNKKVLPIIAQINSNDQEYQNFIVPSISINGPTKTRTSFIPEKEKIARQTEMAELQNATIIRSLMEDMDPTIQPENHLETVFKIKQSSSEPTTSPSYRDKTKRFNLYNEAHTTKFAPEITVVYTNKKLLSTYSVTTDSVHSSTSTVKLSPISITHKFNL